MILTDKSIVGPWVAERVKGHFDPVTSEAIGLYGSKMLAGVIYESWNGASIICHIAVEGIMTPRYLGVIFHYPFVQLNAKKIIVPVSEGNEKSKRFVEKLGFRKEAQLLDAHPDGSILLYTMSKDQCRFIGERYGQKLLPASRA